MKNLAKLGFKIDLGELDEIEYEVYGFIANEINKLDNEEFDKKMKKKP